MGHFYESFVGTAEGSGHAQGGYGLEFDGNTAYRTGAGVGGLGGTVMSAGDVMGIAVDFDNDKIDYYINNVFEVDIMSLSGGVTFDDIAHYAPAVSIGGINQAAILDPKTRLSEFTYTPPTGFSAWSPEA
jgi:hypothetical protein